MDDIPDTDWSGFQLSLWDYYEDYHYHEEKLFLIWETELVEQRTTSKLLDLFLTVSDPARVNIVFVGGTS